MTYRRLVQAIGLGLTIVLGIGTFAFNLPGDVARLVTNQVSPAPPTNGVQLDAGWYLLNYGAALIILALFAATIVAVVLAILYSTGISTRILRADLRAAQNAAAAETQKRTRIEQAFTDMMSGVEAVCSNMNPAINVDGIDQVSSRYDVNGAGDAYGKYVFNFLAKAEPLHYWIFLLEAGESSAEAEYPEDIAFHANAKNANGEPRSVRILPIRNERRKKEFSIWFLPRLEPGEGTQLIVEFQWPGFFRQLIDLGRDKYWWTYRLRGGAGESDHIAQHSFEISFSREIGQIECYDLLPGDHQGTLNVTAKPGGSHMVQYTRECGAGAQVCNLQLIRR